MEPPKIPIGFQTYGRILELSFNHLWNPKLFVSSCKRKLFTALITGFCNGTSLFLVVTFHFCITAFELMTASEKALNSFHVHTFTSNSFLQLLPLHFSFKCWILVFGFIRSAFFSQNGQVAQTCPLMFRINACPFHGSGGFMYSEKSIPSDSNADLMLMVF